MAMTGIQAVDTSVQKMNLWLNDIMSELQWDSREKAYSALRAVLLTVRDRLTIDESADFSAQLPLIIRGIYYDIWRPSVVPVRIRTKEDFSNCVRQFLRSDTDYDAERVSRAVIRVIKKYVTEGEVKDMKALMPKALLDIWE